MEKEEQVSKKIKIKKALVELDEIIEKIVPKEQKNKIPDSFLSFIKENKDPKYIFKYDVQKDFEKQELMHETKILLGMIYMDYWASSEEREILKQKLDENEKKYLEELNNKYSLDELFKKRSQEKNINQEKDNNQEQEKIQKIENLPVKYSESIFKKIIDFIKNLFKKR